MTLCGGDTLNLVPHVIRAAKGTKRKDKETTGIGVSSFILIGDMGCIIMKKAFVIY